MYITLITVQWYHSIILFTFRALLPLHIHGMGTKAYKHFMLISELYVCACMHVHKLEHACISVDHRTYTLLIYQFCTFELQ